DARSGAHLGSTTVSGLAVRWNVGLGSPTNSQPGRLRYVAQASGLRVLAASSRQFWWYLQDAPPRSGQDAFKNGAGTAASARFVFAATLTPPLSVPEILEADGAWK